jgi:hypothetical protein
VAVVFTLHFGRENMPPPCRPPGPIAVGNMPSKAGEENVWNAVDDADSQPTGALAAREDEADQDIGRPRVELSCLQWPGSVWFQAR